MAKKVEGNIMAQFKLSQVNKIILRIINNYDVYIVPQFLYFCLPHPFSRIESLWPVLLSL